jgi:hypothetical protein
MCCSLQWIQIAGCWRRRRRPRIPGDIIAATVCIPSVEGGLVANGAAPSGALTLSRQRTDTGSWLLTRCSRTTPDVAGRAYPERPPARPHRPLSCGFSDGTGPGRIGMVGVRIPPPPPEQPAPSASVIGQRSHPLRAMAASAYRGQRGEPSSSRTQVPCAHRPLAADTTTKAVSGLQRRRLGRRGPRLPVVVRRRRRPRLVWR